MGPTELQALTPVLNKPKTCGKIVLYNNNNRCFDVNASKLLYSSPSRLVWLLSVTKAILLWTSFVTLETNTLSVAKGFFNGHSS